MSDSEPCSNRFELDLISLLVNFSYELGQIMARFDFLWPRWVNLNNVQTDSQLDLISILVNFSCELGQIGGSFQKKIHSLGIRPAGSSGYVSTTSHFARTWTQHPIHHQSSIITPSLVLRSFIYFTVFLLFTVLLHTGISGRQPYGYEMSTLHIYNHYTYKF